jgi:hypothetical protein
MKITRVYISDLGYLMVSTEDQLVTCNHVVGSLRDMLPEEIAKLPIETNSGYILTPKLNETIHE